MLHPAFLTYNMHSNGEDRNLRVQDLFL